jgi:DNA-binding MarR family transcriptional regulator
VDVRSDIDQGRARLARAQTAHLQVLLTADRFCTMLDELCRREGITHHQYEALVAICALDPDHEGMPLGAVAEGLYTRASDVTRLVRRLEEAGLVERQPSAEDRRVVLVRASDAGRDLVERLLPRVEEFHVEQWRGFSDDELSQVEALLARALELVTELQAAIPESPGR